MWIEKLDIRGFKRLSGEHTFSNGLNLVVGDNEAGKSTLHDALVRTLFGFSKKEQRKSGGDGSLLDRCKPWDGGEYGVNALLRHTRDGSLRIEWNFDSHEVRMLDADSGSDLSEKVRGKRKEVKLGEYLLGLGLEEYRGACCLDQGSVSAVNRTEDLVAALQESVQSNSVNVGIEDAIELLGKFSKDTIGSRVDRFEPTKNGGLSSLFEKREHLQRELQQCEMTRTEIGNHYAELFRQRTVRDELGQQILVADFGVLESRLERARGLADKISKSVGEIEDSETLSTVHTRLSDEIARLGAYSGVDNEAENSVRELLGKLGGVGESPGAEHAPEVPERDTDLERFRQERERLLELERAAQSGAWNSRFLIAAAVVGIVSAVLAVLLPPALLVGLPVALVLVALARRRGNDDGSLSEALQGYGVHSTEELDRRVAEEDARISAAASRKSSWEEQQARMEEQRETLRRELAEKLKSVGVSVDQGEEDKARVYLQDCEEAKKLSVAESRLGEVESLRELLNGESLEELQRRVEAGADEYKRRGETAEEAAPGPREQNLTDEARDQLGQRHLEVEREIQRLETLIGDREKSLSSPAELKDGLDGVEAAIERRWQGWEAAQIAREAMTDAASEAYKAFAPQLNEALKKNLSHITGGRYREAVVGDDLSIRVFAPETGRQTPATALSRGTQDQIYLVQRLEVATMLDPKTGNVPLLLDDPFARFDDRRLEFGLEILRDVAGQRQVILFSEDKDLLQRARNVCGDCREIVLPSPE